MRTVHKKKKKRKKKDLLKYMEQKHPAFPLHPAVLQVCTLGNTSLEPHAITLT